MYRRIPLVWTYRAALSGALLLTIFATVHSVPAAAQTPPAESEDLVPEGEPAVISDWALAGVTWADAHLVRRLADAARDRMQNPDARERMGLLVQDCDALIESLEAFGWRRVAAERAELAAADRAVVADEAVATDDAVPGDRVAAPSAPRPFSLGRYRVDDYIDRTRPRTAAEAAEGGVEQSLAEQADDAARGFAELGATVEPAGNDHRRAQTRSKTLPYASETIYDYFPRATYPELPPDAVPVPPDQRIVSPGLEAVAQAETESAAAVADEAALTRRAPRIAAIDLDAYTGEAERFDQDAAWVEFRLRANELRWQMIRDSGDDQSVAALAEQVTAVIIQLKANAATAAAVSGDPQLVEILDGISSDTEGE